MSLKQRLLFVYKEAEQTTFPHLLNADKVRGDNEKAEQKGFTEAFRSDLSSGSSSFSDWSETITKECQKKKKEWPSSEQLLPQIPPSPTLTLPSVSLTHPPFSSCPSPLSRSFSPSCLTARCDPSCTSRSPQQTLGVWRRSGVQAWLRLHPSLCTEEACPAGL